jgi:RNA polymerase sigma-70 factor (sigma-E family)
MAASDAGDFCRRIWPRLVGSLSLYVGDGLVAEDLAQETLSRVWASWETVGAMAAPEAWTYRCAINLANSWYRRRRAERRAYDRLDARADPDDQSDRAAQMSIRDAVRRLPVRQRTAIVLRFYADLPVEQVAGLMECAPGTVKAHTWKGINALRRAGLGEIDEVRDDARTS